MATPTSPDDLDAWVLATAPQAIAYATSLLRDRHRAEDVVQDCYCRLLARREIYDLPRDGLRLLMRSITNACINLHTRRRTILPLHGTQDDSSWDVLDPRALAPEQPLLARELQEATAEALGRLPVQQRAALELRSLGHSQQEVAEMLGITPSHAGVLIHRARQSLARDLAPWLGAENDS